MFHEILENVRKKSPLIHCITNYVTANDCANILLACGGLPIMSDDIVEVEEITSICSALTINIGTLNQNTIPTMFLAGKRANELGLPIILDPVGAGASKFRTQTAQKLIEEIKFTTIRGNISEIKSLARGSGRTKGVDADINDTITDKKLDKAISFAKAFSKETGAVIAITGAIDIVADEKNAYIIRNGNPMMSRITGSGCMLTTMAAAFLAANLDRTFEATAAAVCAMGVCGELAFDKLQISEGGNSTYRNYLIDAVYNLDGETLMRGAKYER